MPLPVDTDGGPVRFSWGPHPCGPTDAIRYALRLLGDLGRDAAGTGLSRPGRVLAVQAHRDQGHVVLGLSRQHARKQGVAHVPQRQAR